MVDVHKLDSAQRQSHPLELHSSYLIMDENLRSLAKFESTRNQMDNNEEELLYLKIHIEYPIQIDRMQTFNTIIIRHAFALHNFYKRKFDFDDRRIFSTQLMDPPLHYYGEKQCEHLKHYLHKIDFSVIFISPMQRTVQTAQQLFHDHPKKNQIKFKLIPIASEKMSSQYSFFRWGRLAQLKADMEKNPDLIRIDLSAFDIYKHKEMWQVEMNNDAQYDLDSISNEITFKSKSIVDSQDKFVHHHFVRHGKSVSIESEEQCYVRGLKLKEMMRLATLMNGGSSNKVGLISHSVLIKTFYAKGLDENKKIMKDPNFYLENGNFTGLNL